MTDIVSYQSEGEVEGHNYANWVRKEVIQGALSDPDASYVSAGGWLAIRDGDERVRVFRLVDEISLRGDNV